MAGVCVLILGGGGGGGGGGDASIDPWALETLATPLGLTLREECTLCSVDVIKVVYHVLSRFYCRFFLFLFEFLKRFSRMEIAVGLVSVYDPKIFNIWWVFLDSK